MNVVHLSMSTAYSTCTTQPQRHKAHTKSQFALTQINGFLFEQSPTMQTISSNLDQNFTTSKQHAVDFTTRVLNGFNRACK